MIVLNRSDFITIKLGGAPSVQPTYTVEYEDYNTGQGSVVGTLNGTSRVTVVTGNTSSTKVRRVLVITVHNKDTSAAMVIIEVNRNSTYYEILRHNLIPDDTAIYASPFTASTAAVGGGGGGTGDYLGLYNNLSDVPSKQTALNTLTNVVAAGIEQILTKDTATGNAVFKTPVQFYAILYKGDWDADTNDPELTDGGGGGITGDYYIINVAGTTEVDGISDWDIGDWIVNNGSVWGKVPNPNLVTSVNTRKGAVLLTSTDVALNNVLNVEQVPVSEKGAANGVATLNAGQEITTSELPDPLYEIVLLSPSNDDLIQRKTGAWTNRTPAQLKIDLSLSKSDVGLSSVPNLDTTNAVNDDHTHANKTTLDAIQQALTTALKADYDEAHTNQHTHSNKTILDGDQESFTTALKSTYDGYASGKQTADSDLTAIANLTPTNDDIIQRKSAAWTNRTMAQLKTDLTLNNVSNDAQLKIASNLSDVNSQQTSLNNVTAVAGAGASQVLTKVGSDAAWADPPGGGSGLTHMEVMSRIMIGI